MPILRRARGHVRRTPPNIRIMKKSPFIIYLMAALLGIQPALATEFSGGSEVTDVPNSYIGVYSNTDQIAKYGNVTIASGTNPDAKKDYQVYGAYAAYDAENTQAWATSSTVTMASGTVAGIYGGYSVAGEADNNTVSMSIGHVTGSVYGGYSEAHDADKNRVSISGDVDGNVIGGYCAGEGTTDDNWVTLTFGAQANIVCGGDTGIQAPNVEVNKTMEEGVISGDEDTVVNGADNAANASYSINNRATIQVGARAGEVYGGASATSYSERNTVEIAGTVDKIVIGGLASGDDASSYSKNNTVTIKDGAKVAKGTSANPKDVFVCGGVSKVGDVTNNSVAINGNSTRSTRVGCDVFGGYSETAGTAVNQNYITVTGGTIDAALYGGCSASWANNNDVLITGGQMVDVYGARGNYAEQNVVIVAGGEVTGTVAGAEAKTTKNNGVYLIGKDATVAIPGTSESIEGNAMELGDVFGAIGSIALSKSSGNSVDVYGSDITANSLQGMQALNFHMVKSLLTSGDPMITLKEAELDLTDFAIPAEGSPVPKLSLTFDAMEAMDWQPGSSVTLVSSALGIKIDESLLNKEYNIYQYGDPSKVAPILEARARLILEQGQGSTQFLKLVVPGDVPEPTTNTLSLLALAALAARRRK